MSWVLSTSPESLVLEVLTPEADASGEIALRYRYRELDGDRTLELTEHVTLPDSPHGPDESAGSSDADGARTPSARLLRLLALAAAPSYYKACVPATIAVPDGLTPLERRFLTAVIGHGLGEFAFRNDVPRALTPTIEAPDLDEVAPVEDSAGDPVRPLVAVGGGKDSVVTIEALRAMGPATGVEPTLFSVNSYAPIEATARAAGLPLVVARRRLDPALFALNDAGALNGHVPVTAVNSVVGLLVAERLGLDAVVFSNEASSSFGNVTWQGVEVNHQWSKGIEFERLLAEAAAGGAARYFSFLRPLTELAIMRRFGQLRDYHPVFTSCNRAFHLDPSRRRLWCGECPKCHFVFLCLSPFVPRAELEAIFGGRDLFADPAQREGFMELLNAGGRMKPFECVGEPDECRAALTLTQRHPDWVGHPFLADPEVAACLVDDVVVERAFAFHDDHLLPASYEKAARALL
ncbi:hypothetical protein IEQ44_02750 [Nocardioides sp. Y6]|uniref:UDP-N-acetyl-alpha-D-muramoyl-L-alanyl-L-glutamate epimerase n=1 Tax=Nocardioides malaquae TaxID=2773426 RepID=A0ABR9RPT1_9ACTN|nr:hypothetical protein [Nocardioides malaquae]MBE7323571.1 hypothetical protein [Nocardioides malaquae]